MNTSTTNKLDQLIFRDYRVGIASSETGIPQELLSKMTMGHHAADPKHVASLAAWAGISEGEVVSRLRRVVEQRLDQLDVLFPLSPTT